MTTIAPTVYSEDMSLHDVSVPLSMAGVVACMEELYPGEVEASIGKDSHIILSQQSQVCLVPSPDKRRGRRSTYVTLNLHIVTHPCRKVVRLQGLVQWHHRET